MKLSNSFYEVPYDNFASENKNPIGFKTFEFRFWKVSKILYSTIFTPKIIEISICQS